MGPYCRFCNNRCFVPMPKGTPRRVLEAYGKAAIIATCPAGQTFEKRKVGYCYDDIKKLLVKEGGQGANAV